MTYNPSDIASIRSSSRAMVRAWNLLSGKFEGVDLPYSECHALFELNRDESLTANDLAALLNVDKSTTSRILKSLEGKGLILTDTSTEDRRVKTLQITQEGKETCRFNNKIVDADVTAALEMMSPADQVTVREGMAIYSKALQQVRLQAGYTIRPIKQDDSPEVAKLIRKVFSEFGVSGEGSSMSDPEMEDLYQAYQGERSRFFVITKDDVVLGCGGFGPLVGKEEDTCELRKMYFYKELRGKGFGKKILLHCLHEAKNLGFKKCYLETSTRMWQAIELYKKLGFKALEGQEGCTGHTACDAFYIKDL